MDERQKVLFSALRAGDWEVASELAVTPQEIAMLERRRDLQNGGMNGGTPPGESVGVIEPLLGDAEARLAAAECERMSALEQARASDAALELARARAEKGATLLLTAKIEAAAPIPAAPFSRCLACLDARQNGAENTRAR